MRRHSLHLLPALRLFTSNNFLAKHLQRGERGRGVNSLISNTKLTCVLELAMMSFVSKDNDKKKLKRINHKGTKNLL